MSLKSYLLTMIFVIVGLKCIPEFQMLEPINPAESPIDEIIPAREIKLATYSPIETDVYSQWHYVKNLFVLDKGNYCRLIVHLNEMPHYQTHILQEPDRFYIDLFSTKISPSSQTQTVNNFLVKQVRTGQFNSSTSRIVVDIKEKILFKIKEDTVHNIILADFYPVTNESSYQPHVDENIYPPKQLLVTNADFKPNPTLAQELGLKVKTIIIDPGHGGKDPGAVYPNGMQEKDITLDIAFKLKQLLLQDGAYKVLLTREDDIFIPLEERTAYANRQNGDLFISIHVNSTTYAANSGIETYYLSLAEDDESRAVAVYENRTATTRYSNLEKLLENIMKNSKIEESAHFADTIQKNLINKSHQQDRGVKKAGFYVLIGANMPSILTEVGFLSNGKDNKLLNNTFYREMIAKALYRGIKDYTYSLLALSENN